MALVEQFRKQGDFLFRYRSFFPIPFFLVGLGIHIYQQLQANGNFIPEYYYAICFGVGLIGLIVRILIIGYVPKGTSGRNTKEQIANTLNTDGMYSIVRHPLYVGNFLMWLGIAMITANIWFIVIFVLAYWIYYERIMYAEEAFLREKFGQTYLDWASKVPAFIPCIRKWQSPNSFFSAKNALRREYTGLFNLVVVFFVFHYAQSVIKNNMDYLFLGENELIWLGILGFTVVFYFTVRILHKGTNLLHVEGR